MISASACVLGVLATDELPALIWHPELPQEQLCAFASINDDGLNFVVVESDWVNTPVLCQTRPWLIGHLLLIVVVLLCARVTHVN